MEKPLYGNLSKFLFLSDGFIIYEGGTSKGQTSAPWLGVPGPQGAGRLGGIFGNWFRGNHPILEMSDYLKGNILKNDGEHEIHEDWELWSCCPQTQHTRLEA